jgi:hypothetical protein
MIRQLEDQRQFDLREANYHISVLLRILVLFVALFVFSFIFDLIFFLQIIGKPYRNTQGEYASSAIAISLCFSVISIVAIIKILRGIFEKDLAE